MPEGLCLRRRTGTCGVVGHRRVERRLSSSRKRWVAVSLVPEGLAVARVDAAAGCTGPTGQVVRRGGAAEVQEGVQRSGRGGDAGADPTRAPAPW